MEREFTEFSEEIERSGLSEEEEDRAIENPTVTTKQQLKKAKAASAVQQIVPAPQKTTKTVWKARTSLHKKKKVIFAQ